MFIIACPKCGAKNQIRGAIDHRRRYRCGKCGNELAYLSTSPPVSIKVEKAPSLHSAPSLGIVLSFITIVVIVSAIFHISPLPWSVRYCDIIPFYKVAVDPGIVYIDKPVQYPVLTGIFIQIAGTLGKTLTGYYYTSCLFLLLFALVATYIIYLIAPDKNNIYRYWVFAPSMLIFAVYNWDLLAILLVLVAFFLLSKRKNYLASASLALGFSSKFYPAIYLLPIIANTKMISHRLKIVCVFIVVCLIVNAPFALINFHGWYDFFSFNNGRLPNPDSIWGVLNYYFPQLNVTLINVVSLIIFALSSLAMVWRCRGEPVLKLCFAMTLIFLICNKVFSVQYILWLLPFFVLTPVKKIGLFHSLDICNLVVLFTILPFLVSSAQSSAFLHTSQIFVVIREALLVYVLYSVLRSSSTGESESSQSIDNNPVKASI